MMCEYCNYINECPKIINISDACCSYEFDDKNFYHLIDHLDYVYTCTVDHISQSIIVNKRKIMFRTKDYVAYKDMYGIIRNMRWKNVFMKSIFPNKDLALKEYYIDEYSVYDLTMDNDLTNQS